ncbi:ariadne RING finger, putative [Entamoeba invadens IP1]|uniref:Ariadne RING finger, putative n=1 Tax=Entamoeba invadens IP1 TaxID=370355 RepID=A0A0A1UDK2_ENTIV|nr:ariadne RING finger, putative [Entamoeba invadens IP1]ELP94636.1 ariadne RING finger, putative [Entamoeba invadens IP1]|eukprot:XP_004261407.1 ariadne RING finger, putative [Entamoeba invadens IP1]
MSNVESAIQLLNIQTTRKIEENLDSDNNTKAAIILDYFKRLKEIQNPTNQVETCEVCFEDMTPENTYIYKPCGHSFCLSCVKDTVKAQIENNKAKIQCMEAGCTSVIPYCDLIQYKLFADEKMFLQFRENSKRVFLNGQPNTRYCPKCETPVIGDPNHPKIVCTTCGISYCFNCRVEYHDGYTCDQYKEWKKLNDKSESMFLEYMKNGGGALCPSCGMAAERISGCNWMYCNPNVGGCGKGYCYVCSKLCDHFSPHILQRNCSLTTVGHN